MVTNHSCKTFGGEQFGDEFVFLQFSSLHNRFTINFLFFQPSGDQTLGPQNESRNAKPWRTPFLYKTRCNLTKLQTKLWTQRRYFYNSH